MKTKPNSEQEPQPAHVVILVPDGVGYRNFVLGHLCSHLPGRVTVLHGLSDQDLDRSHLTEDVDAGRVVFEGLPSFRETPWIRCLREAKSLSQLYRHHDTDAGAIQLGRLKPRGRWRNRALINTARLLAKLGSGKPDRFDAWLRAAVAATPAHTAAVEHLRKLRPDVVFCTHQRASAALPTMTAARELGIPTATFIFSWDNLPKGRMPIDAEQYFVWGPTMVDQMRLYFPGVATSDVIEVGTPQFEPYFDHHRYQSKEAFCTELGLDPTRPIVCFSGDDESTSPKDPVFLRDVAESVRSLTQVDPKHGPQLLFRRAPVDHSGRYQPVLDEFPEIVDAPPRWRAGAGDWQGSLPTNDDVTHLVSLVRHSDLVINLGSTMGMDFAILDKPAIFLDYEPAGPFNPRWNTAAAYQLPHFRSVQEAGPVHWARSPQQLGPLIQTCLANPQALNTQRLKWLAAICRHPLDQASRRTAEALVKLSQRAND